MKKQTEIIIEVERVRVVCNRTRRYLDWCAECGAESEFVTLPEASALANQSLETVGENAERIHLHNALLPDGTSLICLNSLLRA